MSQQSPPPQHQQINNQMQLDKQLIRERMSRIKHKILILSGKGGVGKSTVSVNLAVSLALAGRKTGLLDIDLHGPSIPKVLNLEDTTAQLDGTGLLPTDVSENLRVMSVGLFLEQKDLAVVWRGPRKYHMIKQFLKDVVWGDLDFLIVDSPPGTGDEPLAVVQLLENTAEAVIVTTPQELALSDVRKGINFCRDLDVDILGVIENMSGFACPHCGEVTDIFKSGGAEKMTLEFNVPFLGRIPIDPDIVKACDSGSPYIQQYQQSQAACAFNKAISELLELN